MVWGATNVVWGAALSVRFGGSSVRCGWRSEHSRRQFGPVFLECNSGVGGSRPLVCCVCCVHDRHAEMRLIALWQMSSAVGHVDVYVAIHVSVTRYNVSSYPCRQMTAVRSLNDNTPHNGRPSRRRCQLDRPSVCV